jgi:Ni/Fe-hydrogenase subunit HybB-like protein
MREMAQTQSSTQLWIADKILMGLSLRDYVRSLLTPGNLVVAAIFIVGIPLIVYRFAFGLGASTALTQEAPWGLWIGLDMLSGVALAAGGYTMATAVHIFNIKALRPVVRPALLTGFLGYLFAVIGLTADLGSPWRLPVPIALSHGTMSVMFEVAVRLHLPHGARLQLLPPVFEWLGWSKARQVVVKYAGRDGAARCSRRCTSRRSAGCSWRRTSCTALAFVISRSSSSSRAGRHHDVIFESAVSHRAFRDQLDPHAHVDLDGITLTLARGAAVVLFSLFFLRVQGFLETARWDLLPTAYGAWFLFEVLGFILIPALLFAWATRARKVTFIRALAAWTVLGVVVNRINVSMIAMNWTRSENYVPNWIEIMVSITIITIGVQTFRWIVNRMPVLHEAPGYPAH